MKTRKIIHIDMDAFYASVEQRDNPALKGKPVIVGGEPRSRGVVAACSYEARKFGIHSAMASSMAFRLCPHAVIIKPSFEKYTRVSMQIREIFHEYTDLVEPLSLDEAYLDVTENKVNMPSATLIAEEIRKKIYQKTGLTASAGVSFNKFLAKAASDYKKPNGMTVITPENAAEFIDNLPVGKFYGVGKVTEKKMTDLGIITGADLKKLDVDTLKRLFGKVGVYYYDISHGRDDRSVNPDWISKSIGKERTFSEDISDKKKMLSILEDIAVQLEGELKSEDTIGRTITLKMKYFDFKSITRSITLLKPVNDASSIMKYIPSLLDRTEAGEKKVRLLGISLSNFGSNEEEDIQLEFCFEYS